LAYIRGKKRKDKAKAGVVEKPQFEGQFMPNRFGIKPGHRWDGVDRSNGYEKKWFEVQNAKKAQQEDTYKWSTEDM
jgi:pre-mRNA-splicing factor CWC26